MAMLRIRHVAAWLKHGVLPNFCAQPLRMYTPQLQWHAPQALVAEQWTLQHFRGFLAATEWNSSAFGHTSAKRYRPSWLKAALCFISARSPISPSTLQTLP